MARAVRQRRAQAQARPGGLRLDRRQLLEDGDRVVEPLQARERHPQSGEHVGILRCAAAGGGQNALRFGETLLRGQRQGKVDLRDRRLWRGLQRLPEAALRRGECSLLLFEHAQVDERGNELRLLGDGGLELAPGLAALSGLDQSGRQAVAQRRFLQGRVELQRLLQRLSRRGGAALAGQDDAQAQMGLGGVGKSLDRVAQDLDCRRAFGHCIQRFRQRETQGKVCGRQRDRAAQQLHRLGLAAQRPQRERDVFQRGCGLGVHGRRRLKRRQRAVELAVPLEPLRQSRVRGFAGPIGRGRHKLARPPAFRGPDCGKRTQAEKSGNGPQPHAARHCSYSSGGRAGLDALEPRSGQIRPDRLQNRFPVRGP